MNADKVTKAIALGVLLFVFGGIGACVVISLLTGGLGPPTPPVSSMELTVWPTYTPAATYTPAPPVPTNEPSAPITMKDGGADVTLTVTAGVCPTKADFDELTKLALANDTVGGQQMINSGRVLVVSSGTKAKIIETSFTAYRIRIMSGKYAGRDGWVVREAVQ